ncbi:MAG: ubiquinol-cytochrome c reductase iron-sulfur subunit [Thermomicrobiales bacterium]|nr:Rieske (2Fe-2S) protein [Thermomicrobiales bacterium]
MSERDQRSRDHAPTEIETSSAPNEQLARSQSTLLVDTPRLNDEARHESAEELTRRGLLTKISLLGSAAIGAVVGIPIIGYLLGPLVKPTPSDWRNVGKVDDFSPGETKLVAFDDPSPLPWAGQTARLAAYIRREGQNDQFLAFAVNCTHLGCPVNWQPSSGIFICPCHGGVYYADGTVAAGPPPRRLFTYDTRVANGQVQLRATPLQTS